MDSLKHWLNAKKEHSSKTMKKTKAPASGLGGFGIWKAAFLVERDWIENVFYQALSAGMPLIETTKDLRPVTPLAC